MSINSFARACHRQVPSLMIYVNFQIHFKISVLFNKSFASTPKSFAILSKVSKSGCVVLVHQLDIVTGDFSNCSANHLPVLPFSTSTTLIQFNFAIFIKILGKYIKILL